ncbi:MAG: efflux RND transporter permease subunit [Candidatus Peregrinibacteria bacterium]
MNNIPGENKPAFTASIWDFFIRRRPVAWLTIIGIIIAGVFSVMSLPREIQPEVKIPYVGVSVALPGASPSDTESLLIEPLEKEISNVDNIEVMSSSAGFGFGSVFIEFDAGADSEKVIQDVKDAVDMAKTNLPEDATDPMVTKAEANTFSVVTFSIIGSRPINELTKIADDIKAELEKISGVVSVDVLGGQKKYIEITLDQKKVEGYGLDIQTISNIIKYANNNLPIGIVSSDKLNYSVRIDNRFKSIDEIRNLPLITVPDENNTPILLRDIADIEEKYPPKAVITQLSLNGEAPLPAVSLQVYKKDNADISTVAKNSKEKIEELKESIIPPDIKIAITNDNSVYIEEELGNLTTNGLQTMLAITLILFLALGLRKGIIAGLSLPVIFLITFVVMDIMGLTLNTLSLFSLVIALGLMVDTTIVIMEGIHENLRKGLSPVDSAIMSVQTYKWPLVAGTMTTIFAFFPMLLVSGILGEFLKTLPITISTTLFGSLFVALTIVPALSTKFVKSTKEGEKNSILEPFFDKAGEKFHKAIEYLIQRKSARAFTVLIALAAFAISLSLPITGLLKVELFPKTDTTYFIVRIETPKGVVLEETAKAAAEVEKYIEKIPEVENFITNIGTNRSVGLSGEDEIFVSSGSTESNLANITVNLVDKDKRERKSYEINSELRDELKNFNDAKVTVEELSEGPPSDAAITARITGKDMDTLKEIADEVEKIIADTPGTFDPKQSLTPGLNEFNFTLDKDALAFHGLSSGQVSMAIRNIIQGLNPTSITIGDEDLEILVKYNLDKENEKTNISIHDIENFEISSPKGYSVTLGQLGTYEFGQSLSSIEREDGKRIIKVTSEVEPGVNSVEAITSISEKTDNLEIPAGYEISFGGDLEQITESFTDLFRSMIVAVILIAFTLVLMFNSFKQPLIILLTLPLAIIGVFPGLMAIGLSLSFPAFLGIVALSGVVVNDAIVLMDRINTNRKNGMLFSTSIAEATNARLQPIIMTSITTIVGILPLALTNEFWAGLGFALIFGLVCSTIFTLTVIPMLYYGFEIRKEKKRLAAANG